MNLLGECLAFDKGLKSLIVADEGVCSISQDKDLEEKIEQIY